MKDRYEGNMGPASLLRDMQTLEEEILFSEERLRVLKAQQALVGGVRGDDAHARVFGELLQETEQELYRLYNARQFLKAEKLTNEGVPSEAVAEVLEQGDPLFQQRRK